jgi:hypothetical protein
LHFSNYATEFRLTLNKLQSRLRFGNAPLRGLPPLAGKTPYFVGLRSGIFA